MPSLVHLSRFLGRLGAVALMVLVASCTDSPTQPHTGEPPLARTGQLGVFAQSSALAASGTLVVQVSGPGIVKADGSTPDTLAFNIPMSGGVASGSITVPAGPQRVITVRAFDGITETHRGSVTTDIVVGANPTVVVTLVPLVGDVTVTVSIGTTIVIVRPGVATLGVGDTLRMSAEIRDQNGALVNGRVRWATLNPVRASVDTLGLVTMRDTGEVQIVATYGTVGGSARLSGTPTTSATAYQLTWNGSVNRNWSEPNNWTPHGIGAARVPAATDSVVITAGPANQPILDFCSEQSVRDLAVQAGASISNYCGYGLNVYRTAVVQGTVSVTIHARPGAKLAGQFGGLNVRGDSVTLGDSLRASSLEMSTAGASLRLRGHRLSVSGSFYISQGTVWVEAGDTLDLGGSVTWSGADHTGRITGGVVRFSGTDFNGYRYKASGTNRLVFNRSATGQQSISGFDFYSDPGRASLQRWEVRNRDGVRICGHVAAADTISFASTGTALLVDNLSCGGYYARANGPVVADANVTIGSYLWDLRHPSGTSLVAGTWRPTYTDVYVAGAALTPSHAYQHLRLYAPQQLTGPMAVAANLELDGTGTELVLGGHRVTVGGLFEARTGATLNMTSAADTLVVAANANFQSDTRVAHLSRLTAGLLQVGGTLHGTGFNASGTHRVVMTGSATGADYLYSLNFLSYDQGFQELEIAAGATIGVCGHTRVRGTLTVRSDAVLNEQCGGYYLRVDTDLVTEVRSTVDPYLLQLYNTTGTQNVNGVFSPTTTAIFTPLSAGQLKAGLGYTHLSIHAPVVLPEDLGVNGDLTVTGVAASLSLAGHALTVNGRLNVADNASLSMTNPADSLWVGGPVTWSGASSHVGKLTAGVMVLAGDSFCASNFFASGTHRTVFARTGAPVRVDCVSGSTPQNTPLAQVEVRGYGVLLSCHLYASGNIRVYSGAKVEENCFGGNLWVEDSLVTEAGSAITNGAGYPGNNQLGVVLADSSATMAVGGTYDPHWTYFSALHAAIKPGLGYRNVRIDRSTTFGANVVFDGALDVINDGTILTLGGRTVEVRGSMDLQNTAVVRMNDPNDQLLVGTGDQASNLFWDGGVQAGLLTDGVVKFNGARFYGLRYAAAAPHKFVFTGTASGAAISVEGNPTFGRMEILGTRTVNLNDRATVLDTLKISTPTQLTGTNYLVVGAGSGALVTVPGSDIVMPGVYLDGPSGTKHVQGRFRPTNTYFRSATTEAGALQPGLEYGGLHLEGPYDLDASMNVGGNFSINTSLGELRMNGHRLGVAGRADLFTGSRLVMTSPLDSLLVGGAFDMRSDAGISSLSAGVVTVGGDHLYMQKAGSGASGTHKFVLNGTGTGFQDIYAAGAAGQHDLRHLQIASGRTVRFVSAVQVSGNLAITSPIPVSASLLRVGGVLSTASGSLLTVTSPLELSDASGTAQVLGGLRSTNVTRFLGGAATIAVRGGADSIYYASIDLDGAGTVSGGPLHLGANLTLTTAAASLDVPHASTFGGTVQTYGTLRFVGGATIVNDLIVRRGGGQAIAQGTSGAFVDSRYIFNNEGLSGQQGPSVLDNTVAAQGGGFRFKTGFSYFGGGTLFGPTPVDHP